MGIGQMQQRIRSFNAEGIAARRDALSASKYAGHLTATHAIGGVGQRPFFNANALGGTFDVGGPTVRPSDHTDGNIFTLFQSAQDGGQGGAMTTIGQRAGRTDHHDIARFG